MNAAIRDKAIGRRLARHGMRVTRSDRQPYPFERLARYRAAAAAISADTFCTVTGVQPGRPAVSPCDDALLAPRLPASGQQPPDFSDAPDADEAPRTYADRRGE